MAHRRAERDGDLGNPEPGAAISDPETGEQIGVVDQIDGDIWRYRMTAPRKRPGERRCRVYLPYEWDEPDFSGVAQFTPDTVFERLNNA